MGLSEKMNSFAASVKTGVQSGTMRFLIASIRFLTGLFLGLTLALIGQEVAAYGTLSFVFVALLVLITFMRMSKAWSLGSVLIFDLVMILVGQLLKMYILLAP